MVSKVHGANPVLKTDISPSCKFGLRLRGIRIVRGGDETLSRLVFPIRRLGGHFEETVKVSTNIRVQIPRQIGHGVHPVGIIFSAAPGLGHQRDNELAIPW
ncbi:hypothetical protein GCM10023190_22180 [Enteractinococcus fodinae]